MILDINEIKNIIPHRYPFLLVDKVEIDENDTNKIIGYKNITSNEEYFNGHFPGNPVMPGVLQIEFMAQTGAVFILSKDEYKGKTAYFGGIDKVKFKEMVKPGDILHCEITMQKCKGPVGVASGICYVNDKICAKAELTFIIK